jgi:hypothetical protein
MYPVRFIEERLLAQVWLVSMSVGRSVCLIFSPQLFSLDRDTWKMYLYSMLVVTDNIWSSLSRPTLDGIMSLDEYAKPVFRTLLRCSWRYSTKFWRMTLSWIVTDQVWVSLCLTNFDEIMPLRLLDELQKEIMLDSYSFVSVDIFLAGLSCW